MPLGALKVDIDDTLHKRVKLLAVQLGRSIKDLVAEALGKLLAEYEEPISHKQQK